MKAKQPTEKPCKAPDCTNTFKQWSSLQKACSPACALSLVEAQRKKAFDKETRKLRREFRLDDKPHWKGKAIRACNEYIRARDGDTCISCGDRSGRQTHAGHYLAAGSTRGASLRFCHHNIHSQCARCNTFLSGNLVEYRENLIKKIGLDLVEWLDKGDHKPFKFTLEDYKDITEHFKEQLRRLNERHQ